MDLTRGSVREIFKSKRISHLYHANSVLTSCTFLKEGALISRGNVERRSMLQTLQESDAVDKKVGVWHDVFVDTVDIHDRAKNRNVYGPVLFEIDTEGLLSESLGKIWVSKLNPMNWEGKTRKDRWFQSTNELAEKFYKGTFDHMVIFRHSGGEVPLKKHLKRIILDDPGYYYSKKDEIDYYSLAYGAIKLSMTLGGIDVPISKRICNEACKCEKAYSDSLFRKKMFLPF